MNMEKIIKIAFVFLALLLGVAVYLAVTMDRSRHEVNSSVKSTTASGATAQNNAQTNSAPAQAKQTEENITTKEQALPAKQAAQQANTSADKKVKVSEKQKEVKNTKKEDRKVGYDDDPAIGKGQKFKPNTIIPKGE